MFNQFSTDKPCLEWDRSSIQLSRQLRRRLLFGLLRGASRLPRQTTGHGLFDSRAPRDDHQAEKCRKPRNDTGSSVHSRTIHLHLCLDGIDGKNRMMKGNSFHSKASRQQVLNFIPGPDLERLRRRRHHTSAVRRKIKHSDVRTVTLLFNSSDSFNCRCSSLVFCYTLSVW